MGGIKVNADTQESTVPGLFACGECAGGMHGANRLGGNSLSDLLVFGRLSGIGAAEYVKKLPASPQINSEQVNKEINHVTDYLNRESGLNPYTVHEELQDVLARYVNIVRTEEELKTALEKLKELKEKVKQVKADGASQYNPGWHEAISLENLIISAEAVTLGALTRQESRGGHTRIDFPDESEEWVKYNIILRKGKDGNMELEKYLRPEPPKYLADIAYAKLEDLEKLPVERDVKE
jgi:succinate dehydrogenase / fumarate reductase, flavoprotein subunit